MFDRISREEISALQTEIKGLRETVSNLFKMLPTEKISIIEKQIAFLNKSAETKINIGDIVALKTKFEDFRDSVIKSNSAFQDRINKSIEKLNTRMDITLDSFRKIFPSPEQKFHKRKKKK